MVVYVCQCGTDRIYSTMGVSRCSRCANCGSSFALVGINVREAPEPHTYVTRYDNVTGTPYELCSQCGEEIVPVPS